MPRYKVLRPIEHNLKLYLPELPDALTTVRSAGHGGDIPVDSKGAIELSKAEAAVLIDTQIPMDESGNPVPLDELSPETDEPAAAPPEPEKKKKK